MRDHYSGQITKFWCGSSQTNLLDFCCADLNPCSSRLPGDRYMRKFLLLFLLVTAAYGFIQSTEVSIPALSESTSSSEQLLEDAFENQRSDFQVEGQGTVIKLLPDDLEGSKHQRFIIRLSSGQTLLIAHNIDLAPRINSLQEGDSIQFYGEYEWNPEGGVIHWTHDDPAGRHIGGWIRHDGLIYQ